MYNNALKALDKERLVANNQTNRSGGSSSSSSGSRRKRSRCSSSSGGRKRPRASESSESVFHMPGSAVHSMTGTTTGVSESPLFGGDAANEQSVREQQLVALTAAASTAADADMSEGSITFSSGDGVIRSRIDSDNNNSWLDDVSSMPQTTVLGRDTHTPGNAMPPPPRPAQIRPVRQPNSEFADECPICCEQHRTLFANNRQMEDSVDAQASGVKATARKAKAQKAIRKLTTDRYAVIFRVEAVLHGLLSDEQLLPLLLKLHRRLIERMLRRYGMPFTPWTPAMLRAHYDPVNGHVFDKLRTTKHDLVEIRDVLSMLKSHMEEPHPDNPGRMKLNEQAARLYIKGMEHKLRLVKEIDRMIGEQDEQLSASVRSLISTIENGSATQQQSAALTRDPRTAAGNMATGGDMRTSANQATSTAVGSSYDFYNISGF